MFSGVGVGAVSYSDHLETPNALGARAPGSIPRPIPRDEPNLIILHLFAQPWYQSPAYFLVGVYEEGGLDIYLFASCVRVQPRK